MAGLVPAISFRSALCSTKRDRRDKPGDDRLKTAMAILSSLTGPFIRFGLVVAVITALIDQASKLYLLFVFELGARGVVRVAPFTDFVLTKNTGISYGLFQGQSALWQWVLLGIKAAAVVVLVVWLTRSAGRLTALSLGLIIGGAIGNAIDRLAYGWVADFVHFHIETASWRFSWYVFNLADVAIVAGVVGLLYESVFSGRAAKAP
jgi:signal peptidase II